MKHYITEDDTETCVQQVKNLRDTVESLEKSIENNDRHWGAIADVIGTNGGYGGVDCDPKEPFGNAAQVIAIFRKQHQGCVTPCDSIRIQNENEAAFIDAMKWAGIGGLMRTKVLNRLHRLSLPTPKED